MPPKTSDAAKRAQKWEHVRGEGPNWVLIAGGALLSTVSIQLGCRLKQAFEMRRSKNGLRETGECATKRRPGTCPLHSSLYCYSKSDDRCCHCISGGVDKQTSVSPTPKEELLSLPLVKIPSSESSKDNGGVMWASSPDRLIELPPKPFHQSNGSDSPCLSESGSDIYSKREVIQKLRQQLRRRDDMIMEMQAQLTDLQSSIALQSNQNANLQSQLDSANRDLFDSQREIQRLRKAIADHCLAEMGEPEKTVVVTRNWRTERVNGKVNGYLDSMEFEGLEHHCIGVDKGRADEDRVEMLKREIGELKEVIEGKEFLLQSYKEQKVELNSKIKELQLRLSSQVPNIL